MTHRGGPRRRKWAFWGPGAGGRGSLDVWGGTDGHLLQGSCWLLGLEPETVLWPAALGSTCPGGLIPSAGPERHVTAVRPAFQPLAFAGFPPPYVEGCKDRWWRVKRRGRMDPPCPHPDTPAWIPAGSGSGRCGNRRWFHVMWRAGRWEAHSRWICPSCGWSRRGRSGFLWSRGWAQWRSSGTGCELLGARQRQTVPKQ